MNTMQENEMQTAVVENRAWPRLKCDIDTYCATFMDRWSCKIVDLSERGLGIVCSTTLRKGSMINFLDPKTKAQVVWVKNNRAGLKIIN